MKYKGPISSMIKIQLTTTAIMTIIHSSFKKKKLYEVLKINCVVAILLSTYMQLGKEV